MRPRSDSAPKERVGGEVHATLDDDELIALLRANCQHAAITYVNNMMTDRPDTVASCTFYRAGTLVVTRPEAVQDMPLRIDATVGLQAEEVVVSRMAAADRTGAEHYDLVHVVSQPSVRLLFVHFAAASDALVRAAAVAVVNEDVENNVTTMKNIVAVAAVATATFIPEAIPEAISEAIPEGTDAGEFEVVVLHENGDTVSQKARPKKKRVSNTRDVARKSERCSDGSDDCAADDLEAGSAKGGTPFDAVESTTAGLVRRCVIL